jgi:spore germination protein GerM
MKNKKLYIIGFLFVLLIVLVVLFFKSGGEEKLRQVPSVSQLETDNLSDEPKETKKITIFFSSEEDALLHPEEREIIAGSSIVHQAIQTIQQLLEGSRDGYLLPFPPETELRDLFITEQNIAYVDFSRDIYEQHLSGSSAEIMTVYSIVNSLTYNFESIKRVFILVEGGERETLGGHLDLSRPFLPRYDLIRN